MLMKKKYVKFLSKFFLMDFVFPSDQKRPKGHKNKFEGCMRPAGRTSVLSEIANLKLSLKL